MNCLNCFIVYRVLLTALGSGALWSPRRRLSRSRSCEVWWWGGFALLDVDVAALDVGKLAFWMHIPPLLVSMLPRCRQVLYVHYFDVVAVAVVSFGR